MPKIYPFFFITCLILAGMYLPSCKKTVYQHEKSPYNDIQEFTIKGATGDSVKCLISGDTITVFWDPTVQLPANITPKIVVDENATISPSSGQSVPFNNTTLYTVTAADGTTKIYHLNPVLDIPIPSITTDSLSAIWLNDGQITIQGQYFLATGDTSAIHVYMKRVADGVEFPLQLIKEQVSNYSVSAMLPDFSASQDTGLHKVYIKVGNRVTNSINLRMMMPWISNANPASHLVQEGQPVHTGDVLTINYSFSDDYGGKIGKYYEGNVAQVIFYNSDYITFSVTDIKVTDSTVKVTMPDLTSNVGKSLVMYRFIFSDEPSDPGAAYWYHLNGFLTTPCPVVAN